MEKKKIIVLIVFLGAMAAAMALLFGILGLSGKIVSRKGSRIGYVESASADTWKASYISLDGTLTKNMNFKQGNVKVEIVTEFGSISLEITDANGDVLYRGNNLSSCSFTVATGKNVKIKINAKNHEGSFSFTEEKG